MKLETRMKLAKLCRKKKEDVEKKKKEELEKSGEFQTKGIDSLLAANALMLGIAFVGLATVSPSTQSLSVLDSCNCSTEYAKLLLLFEILTFIFLVLSFFLYASAKRIIERATLQESKPSRKILLFHLYLGILMSVFALLCLCASLVDMIMIKLGKFTCLSVLTQLIIVSGPTLTVLGYVAYAYTISYKFA